MSWQLHAEAGKGQFEIALGHKACTLSADHLAFTREVIRSIARKHGLLATFVPKWVRASASNTKFIHYSYMKGLKDWKGTIVFLVLFLCYNHSEHVILSASHYTTWCLLRYYLDDIGSGSHVHLSLWKDGKNVFMGSESSKTEHGMSVTGEMFMAGVFHHLPSILAFIAPLPNRWGSSFKMAARKHPHSIDL